MQPPMDAADQNGREGNTIQETLWARRLICPSCERIADQYGTWRKPEEYVADHVRLEFARCPDCRPVVRWLAGAVR
jgi:hypothetical protein